ncbi:DUF6194 family protein [Clostridioides difficile]
MKLHFVYSWMAWVCALNPSEKTFKKLKVMIQESYDLAKKKFAKRIKSNSI